MRLRRLLGLASAATAHLMESLPNVPEGWKQVGVPDSGQRVLLRIAMASPGQDVFEQTLMDVSTPGTSTYGRHLSRDQLKDMLRPTSAATATVMSWLKRAGVSHDSIVDDGDWINFVTNIKVAENLLNTTFRSYRGREGLTKIRTLQYCVPSPLHDLIDMIQPTTRFGDVRMQASVSREMRRLGKKPTLISSAQGSVLKSSGSRPNNEDEETKSDSEGNSGGCESVITPTCIRELYKMPARPYKRRRNTKGFMAVANFLGELQRYDDFEAFQAKYAPYAMGSRITTEKIHGAVDDQDSLHMSIEANLDSQYMQAIGAPVPMHSYITAGVAAHVPDLDHPESKSNNEPYLDFLTHLLALPNEKLPHTLSISYGENEQSVPVRYRTRVCNMFGQLSARGVSIFTASGDIGVSSACQKNDGSGHLWFTPTFPAACPWLTAVGATTGFRREHAIDASGGGFSDHFARPRYQDRALKTWFHQHGADQAQRWQGLYNPSGRAIPDVAAQGMSFRVVDKGKETFMSGTSAAVPVFAAMIAVINEARLDAGKHALGFINPWLYGAGTEALNDIVHGGSRGCSGQSVVSQKKTPLVPFASWNATVGWDAVSGLGTPNFAKLMQAGMKAGRL